MNGYVYMVLILINGLFTAPEVSDGSPVVPVYPTMQACRAHADSRNQSVPANVLGRAVCVAADVRTPQSEVAHEWDTDKYIIRQRAGCAAKSPQEIAQLKPGICPEH